MISYEAALAIVQEAGAQKPLMPEACPLTAVSGRVAAADIRAPMAHQPFDNSAMDGYALRAEDAAKPLTQIGTVLAGQAEDLPSLEAGQCYAIMTGAPLPQGADAVVPIEKTTKNGDTIRIEGAVTAGDFIRRAGADYQVDDVVLHKGTLLGAEQVLALATLGVGMVGVIQQPRIALLSTGAEVLDELQSALHTGQIYNATKPFLITRLAEMGCRAYSALSVGDNAAAYEEELFRVAENVDVIISTGAVSMGEEDFVPQVLEKLGAEILFHKVAIRPGKPVLLARFASGALFVGLPGNPASTATGWRFFVQPLLRAMQGRAPEQPCYGVLKTAYRKGDAPLRFFMRAELGYNAQGQCEVEILPSQPSFKVSPFVDTQGWAVIPEEVSELPAGAPVAFYR